MYLLSQLKMEIKYTVKPRQYKLTPSRKYIGKSLARGKPKAIAQKCWRHAKIKSYLLLCLCITLQREVAEMCSDSFISILRKSDVDNMCQFDFTVLISEMEEHAPTFLRILRACTKTKVQKNKDCVVGICAAVILKHRRPCMSLVQKLISIILYVGQSSKMVIINIRFKIFMDAHVKTLQLKIVLCSKIIGISTVKANEPYNVVSVNY